VNDQDMDVSGKTRHQITAARGMELRILGELEIQDREVRRGPGDLGGRKPKQVLELLAAAGGRPVGKEALIEQLWGDAPPRRPVAALENHVWVLRRHLAGPSGVRPIVASPGSYRLAIERVVLDLARFDALVRSAAVNGPAESSRALREALALVRGEVFADEPYAEWALAIRETYRAKIEDARVTLVEVALTGQDVGTAIEQASTVLRQDPLSERASRLLMHAYRQRGDRDRALAVFETLRRRLRTELGVEPLPETLAAFDAVRRGGPETAAPALTAAPAPPASAGRPDPAPAPPQQGRTPLIGRRSEVARLHRQLREGLADGVGVVHVEGLAHVGKTRVVEEACALLDGVPSFWARFTAASHGLSGLVFGRAFVAPLELPRAREVPALTVDGVCQEVARRAPLVLVVDDAHHAGAEAIEMLAHLHLRLVGVPAVVVVVCRREQVPARHPLRALPRHGHVQIEPLGPEELGADAERIVDRTGGCGGYVAAWYRGEREGPPSADLLEAVLERCQTAGPRAYRIALAAAAFDGPLSPARLAAATGLRVHHVAEDLERLSARGLLRELAAERFVFDCTLVADALRDQLSSTRRGLLRSTSRGGPGFGSLERARR
jgi:DNA-binding SARP family transcriptional activator